MRHGNRTLLGGLLLIVGAAVGFGGARLGAAASSSPVAAREGLGLPPDSRLGELNRVMAQQSAALVELRASLDSMQSVLEGLGSIPFARMEPMRVPAGEDAAAELSASMNALAAALRSLESGGLPAGGGSGLTLPDAVDLAVAFKTEDLRDSVLSDPDGELARAEREALLERHFFWSKQDVLTSYGKPDRIYKSDGDSCWSYRIDRLGGEEGIEFAFDEGVVVGLDYYFRR